MKYLVTGINGTVGGNIFRRLGDLATNEVWGISKSTYRFENTLTLAAKSRVKKVDLMYPNELKKSLPDFFDVVIHAAAVTPGYKDDKSDFLNNSLMAKTISHYINEIDCGLTFYISTGSVYSINQGICSEESETNPLGEYGKSMIDAENVLKSNIKKLKILRLFYPYSFDSITKDNNLISKLTARIRNDEPIQLNSRANSNFINPFFMNDLIMVINALTTESNENYLYNVAGPSKFPFMEMIKEISILVKKEAIIKLDDEIPDPMFADVAKLNNVIDESKFTKFSTGLKYKQ